MKYYVYIHRDPVSQDDLYVGMGQGDRAYRVSCHSGLKYSDRHPDHSKHLSNLLDKGYLPHQWVIFDSLSLSRSEAFKREKELIKEYRPRYNFKLGPKKKLDDNEVKEIKELRSKGLPYKDIAKQFSCSINTIARIITKSRGEY